MLVMETASVMLLIQASLPAILVQAGPPVRLEDIPESIRDAFAEEGGITWYGKKWEGRHLYCDQFMPGDQVYGPDTPPWLALDVSRYESGEVRCGDWFAVLFYDGTVEYVQALDAGHHSQYTVWDTGLVVLADLPRYWRDGRVTATGRLVHLSALERAFGEEAWQNHAITVD